MKTGWLFLCWCFQLLHLVHSFQPSRTRCCTHCCWAQQKKPEDFSPDDNLLIATTEKIGDFLQQPTPGIPSLAIGFPVALLGWTVVTHNIAAVVLFAVWAVLGRQLVDEDDSWMMDAISLGLAVLCSQVLFPTDQSLDLGFLVGIFVFVLALAQVLSALPAMERTTPEERLMDEWDDEFRKQQKKR